jgi:hypothetical protein
MEDLCGAVGIATSVDDIAFVFEKSAGKRTDVRIVVNKEDLTGLAVGRK